MFSRLFLRILKARIPDVQLQVRMAFAYFRAYSREQVEHNSWREPFRIISGSDNHSVEALTNQTNSEQRECPYGAVRTRLTRRPDAQ